ncbi:MAG: gas vesicle protein [Pirellulaceae bacterium]|nr:gas vesicle protein [Pirellulaceae bacterium]
MSQDSLAGTISLCDALDRVLTKGVVVYGDITVSVAGVDLLYIGLRGLICSIDALDRLPESLQTRSSRNAATAGHSDEGQYGVEP